MPGKIAAIRQIPEALKQSQTIAILAMLVAITALVIAMGARHGS